MYLQRKVDSCLLWDFYAALTVDTHGPLQTLLCFVFNSQHPLWHNSCIDMWLLPALHFTVQPTVPGHCLLTSVMLKSQAWSCLLMDRLAASNAQDIIEYACSVNTCVLTVSAHTRSMRYVLCSGGSTDEALAMLCSSSTNVIFIWSISLITTERTSFHRLISVSCRNCCRSSSCIHSSCDFGKSLQGNASQQLVNN